jgi:hypothetical protein
MLVYALNAHISNTEWGSRHYSGPCTYITKLLFYQVLQVHIAARKFQSKKLSKNGPQASIIGIHEIIFCCIRLPFLYSRTAKGKKAFYSRNQTFVLALFELI